ncbi:hypothetical protein K7640_07115 [Micromonospora sp. PLK6-60]|uniref:hypothetical protein n=1 Tax=Micromonospora sp. PLK6-60 TaxID=2873383 RepID=UPI001CA77580|nr:hypothetical protein [Micromonospora sp. PLK6-60]MBY8871614.1 hypothetical protein [Micromonospora sp. PLK6-60]
MRTADGALRRQRIALLTALALGVVGGLLVRRQPTGPLPVVLAALGLLAGLSVTAFRPSGRRELRVGPGELYAPPRGVLSLPLVVTAWLPYQLLQYEGDWRRDPVGWLLGGAVLAVLANLVAAQWRRTPRIALTAAGIVARQWVRPVRVPWAALDPAMPIHAMEHDRAVRLFLEQPELVEGRLLRRRDELWLRTGDFDVSPAYLAAAIRYYRAHPERRAGIGDAEEQRRLAAALGG